MPLFEIQDSTLRPVSQESVLEERVLQRLIEANLSAVFNCRLVASEFSTGGQHGGRIDTMALSEDGNPVIIEYKKVESSALINQSLYYLAWIVDHRGDFERAVQKSLGAKVEVDWSAIRVLCIAPSFKKYDLLAVEMMGANIELWTYKLFANGCIYFEDVRQRSYASSADAASTGTKNPKMVEAGRKAALSRATGQYTFEEHLEGRSSAIRELARGVQEYVQQIDTAIEEAPKKKYISYRTSQNILCMEIQTRKILLFLKLNPKDVAGPKGISRDVSGVGHYGTGDLEIALKDSRDLEAAKPFITLAYQSVGA